MFNSKKSVLIEKANAPKSTGNAFVNAGLKTSAETFTGNGGKAYTTTGNPFVDQFGLLGSYMTQRSFADVSRDMSTLWAINPYLTVAFTIYMRIITRVVSLFDGVKTSTVQRGAGLRHEAMLRMIWLHVYQPATFWKNVTLYIAAGSWRDVFAMLSYDLQYNGWNGRVLDWNRLGQLIVSALQDKEHRELIKKWMPSIKSNNQCKTLEAQADNLIAKWLCSLIFGGKTQEDNYKNYRSYRKLKATGTAHQWQQLISKKQFKDIDFGKIHGRALAKLVSGKFLTNQNLEKVYMDWVEKQPFVKFTGYVHELFQPYLKEDRRSGNYFIEAKMHQRHTIIKQFNHMVETAKQNAVDTTNMIAVLDTSGSMSAQATNTTISCRNLSKAIGLFISHMLDKGHFANSWIEFNNIVTMHKWIGSDVIEKWNNDTSSVVGSTNFLGVIEFFVKIKKSGVPESEFPGGIICISDCEFNPSHLDETGVEGAYRMLREGGFSEEYISRFKIVLWNLQSYAYNNTAGTRFQTYGNADNVYYFSGYDASTVAFLTGVKDESGRVKSEPKNAEELFLAAMDQELLRLIEV